jgi:hypothetical protein
MIFQAVKSQYPAIAATMIYISTILMRLPLELGD